MLIGGLQKTTLLDYPGKVAATIFTVGCNFRCLFCYNPDIVKGVSKLIPEDELFSFLKKRGKLLDGVCLTGGEPTLQKGIIGFIEKLKALKLLVKLDTNGQNPDLLEKLINRKLIDYAAMDIKAPWANYEKVCCRPLDLTAIKKSVIILKRGKVEYEFRSTVLPALHSVADLTAMAEQVKGADKYYFQQFKPSVKLVSDSLVNEKPFGRRELGEIVKQFKDWFRVCEVR